MLGSDAATAQPTAAAITAVAAATAADDDGVTRTEHEQTDCTTDMTRFRDEQSGQKRKKTATKVTRENVRTAVSNDGIDHDLLRSKFDRVLPPSGGGMKPAPPGGGRRMPAPPGGVGKPTPLLESNLRSREWFEDMTKRRDERWAKFMQQNNKNSGAENSDKMFSKFWDDQANSFKKTMEQTKWGMNDAPGAGKSRRSTTSTSSSADTVEEKIPTTPPSPPLPTEGAGDAADVGAGGTVSDNGGKLNGARMTSIVCEGGSSSRRSVQSEDRFTLLSENGISSRLSSGFGSLHPRMSTADSETSDTPFSGSLPRPGSLLEDMRNRGITVGKPVVKKTTNSYAFTRSKTSYQCSVGDKTYSYNQEQTNEEYEHAIEEDASEDDDDDEEVFAEDDLEEVVCPADVTSLVSEASTIAPCDASIILEGTADDEKKKYHLYRIALEILTTERTYVDKLNLIDQVLHARLDAANERHNMFPDDVTKRMFSNMKSVYQLHHDFVLPQLEQRMQEWEKVKRIGDIMLRFAPFLKMYTEYVNNYEMAQKLINIWLVKSNRFRAIVDELSKLPECDNMLILNHMLVPVQRVPRYELLLKEYLKRLPGDSADRADAEKALTCVSAAAHHINNAMRKIHKFKKLLEIRDLLGGAVDLVSPSREFIKEGRLVKISARSGDHQERYLFLFSDMALLCSELSVSRRGAKYKVRARLQVDQLQCLEGDNLEIENTLYIKTHVRAIELYTRTPFEKMQWMESLLKVIQDYEAKCNSVRISEELLKIEDKELGRCAPTFAKGAAVPVCMNCKAAFGLLRKRKHCKACGAVVCAKCIHGKMALPYDQHKLNKVCRKCYQTMQRITQEKERKMKGDAPIARPERLNVPKVEAADMNSLHSGYMLLRTKGRGKSWSRRWLALHSDGVLYTFTSDQATASQTSMPLLGWTVSAIDKSDNIDKANVFKLQCKKKIYYFQTENKEKMDKWKSVLDKATKAHTPDTTS